jgi:alanine racemase
MAERTAAPPSAPAAAATERVQARVNLAAIERNCARLRAGTREGVQLCAVVKADGYGHGALASARAALAGGASWLAVVTAAELRELREGGIDGPVLVMGALTSLELGQALAAGGDVVVWNERDVRAVADAGGGRVHVKLDSGMGRLGTRDPAQASAVVAAVDSSPGVELAGAMTHFATADELHDGGFFDAQLDAFGGWVRDLKAARSGLLVHAANSAAALRDAGAQFDMVRAGIAIYGMDPYGEDAAARDLEPALELHTYVADVKPCRAGESAGYGRRFIAERDTVIAVLPVGYGDGWRRGLTNNCEVLIGGVRHPLVGTISMDSSTVDLGPDGSAALLGEQAVLIGAQGAGRITAEEVAARLGTINYEITCGLSARVPRVHHRDGASDDAAGLPAGAASAARDGASSQAPAAGESAAAGES